MNRDEVEAWVNTLPSNGEWWHSSGRLMFIHALRRLLEVLSADEAKDMLESLYSAVAEEYGE